MAESEQVADAGYPNLPATSWAVLGMLTHGEAMTGYDLKKWADWSIGFFYWSPSVSQIYAELKKLETIGFVGSRQISEPGVRGRREYAITAAGTHASRNWSRDAPVETPVLKHGVLLRLWMGHLNEPQQLKKIVRAHMEKVKEQRHDALLHAEHSMEEAAWAFSTMSLRWAVRYFDSELEMAQLLLDDIDEAARRFALVEETDELGNPVPRIPGRWREVEDFVNERKTFRDI